ncbi:MAG TPA: hypothetical protein PKA05_04820 [Roseiflexaceae bacterium]|nr:hypothetical protein [Roseiflexaceae bacterium]HMP39684.1 hypothetical protein [Roseiflexaceae bacterium]
MEILLALVRYAFIVALVIEGVLVLRALIRLAREKATPAAEPSVEN